MIKNLINEPIRYVDVQATWVILDEVTTEITKLHEDNAATGTGHAKDTLREIMCSCPFERHSAKNAPKAELIEGKLGLDSPTDHAILSYAIALAETTPVTRVVILTYDSGLRLEIASQARERGRRISTDLGGPCDSESYYDKVSDYLLHELGIGRIT